MSHPELFKRLSKLSVVLLFIAAFFIIDGCRKAATFQDISAGLTDPEVLQAKSWYDITYPTNTGNGNPGRMSASGFGGESKYDYSQHVKPWWQHTAKYSRFGKHVFEVPIDPTNPVLLALQNKTTGKFIAPKENSRSSFLIMDSATGYEAYIMTIIADSAYLNGDHGKLNRNTYNKRDTDFSGMVFYFTPKGNYLNGYAYKNGHLLSPSSSSARPIKGNVVQNQGKLKTNGAVVPDDPDGCTTYYLAYYDSDGYLVSYTYLYQICDPTPGSGSPGPGSAPAPPPPPNCTPPPVEEVSIPKLHINNVPLPPDDGDGFPSPDPKPDPCHPVVPTIVDSLKNPCLKAVVKYVMDGGMEVYTANIANFVFGSTDSFDLIWAQTNTLPNNVDGTTDANGKAPGGFVATIHLNANILPTSSKEYIAATAMHEILHAYMDFDNVLAGFNQHGYMVTNYLYAMSYDLKQLFPGISDDDATALAWGGLGETTAWLDLVRDHPDQANAIVEKNKQYKDATGTKGTRCQL
jgi:hypothetical protein